GWLLTSGTYSTYVTVLLESTTKTARARRRSSLMRTPQFCPKEASRWSERVTTFSTPAAPHQRAWAKGRSMLMVYTLTPSRLAASSLNRRTSASHTPVSSEGTERKIRTPEVSLSVTVERSLATTVKSRALSPTLTSSPTKVTGLPRMVT